MTTLPNGDYIVRILPPVYDLKAVNSTYIAHIYFRDDKFPFLELTTTQSGIAPISETILEQWKARIAEHMGLQAT